MQGITSPRRVRRWHAAGAILIGLLQTASAGAQGPRATSPTPDARGPCSAPPSAEPRTAAEEARALYQQFECHFARAEYSECLAYIERACHLTSSPSCLLNLGAVHHALMHCSLARGYYEQFLDRAPYDDGGDEAKGALHEIQAACPSHEAAPAQATPPDPSTGDVIRPLPVASGPLRSGAPQQPQRPTSPAPAVRAYSSASSDALAFDVASVTPTRRALAWSLLGAGAATAVSTLLLGSYGMRAESDFDARDRHNGALGLAGDSELRAIDRRGRRYNDLMIGVGAASGLLLAAGSTLLLIDLGGSAELAISASGAPGVDLRRSF
jgi:hypothetical protein